MTVAKVWDGSTWVEIVGAPGPMGPTGPQGPPAYWAAPSTPPNTDYLWVDTDEAEVPWQPPQVVTVLPASPADGQEVYYDHGTGKWHLRYSAAWNAFDTYGWEFLGGAPLRNADVANASATVATNTWSVVASPYPQVNAPLTGLYDIRHGVSLNHATANCTIYTGLQIGGVNPAAGGPLTIWEYLNTNTGSLNLNLEVRTLVAAGAAVIPVHYHNAAAGAMGRNNSYVTITPWRVKA